MYASTCPFLKWAVLLISCTIFGCTAPGQPPIIDDDSPEGEHLIEGCQNVQADAKIASFITESYLTTWFSAFKEGASAGIQDSTTGSDPASVLLRLLAPTEKYYGGQKLAGSFVLPEPFCMTVDKPIDEATRDLSKVFSQLRVFGYTKKVLSSDPMVFSTNFVHNSHKMAQWLDRYTAYASPVTDVTSVIYVLREVYISRDETGYYQGVSVGNNEAWILSRTRDM